MSYQNCLKFNLFATDMENASSDHMNALLGYEMLVLITNGTLKNLNTPRAYV